MVTSADELTTVYRKATGGATPYMRLVGRLRPLDPPFSTHIDFRPPIWKTDINFRPYILKLW